MARSDPLADRQTIVAFGTNVAACCEIVGISIESLSIRTEIDPGVLDDYRNGNRHLSKPDIDAVCAEFGIPDRDLVHHYGTSEHRTEVLTNLLVRAGYKLPVVASREESEQMATGSDIAETPQEPAIDPIETTPEPEIAAKEEPMETVEVMDAEASASLKWDDNDFVAYTGSGERFNLQQKELRTRIIGNVRTILASTEGTFADLIKRAGLNKPSSWPRGVELATSRISGVEVEALAEALGVTPYALLSGMNQPAPTPTVEQSVEPAATPEPVVVQLAEPAADISAPKPADDQEYFRRLLLSRHTQPAPGVEVGQLLELARDQEGVDWITSYLTLTKGGEELRIAIEALQERVRVLDQPIQAMYLKALAEACA